MFRGWRLDKLSSKDLYDRFVNDVTEYTDKIDPRKSLQRRRSGKAWLRDAFVFVKQMSGYGRQWLVPLLTFVTMMSLTPMAFENFNSFLKLLIGIKPFPVGWSSIVSILGGFCIILLGTWGYKRGGVEKTTKEVREQQDPVYLMQYDKLTKIEEKLDKMEDRIRELENQSS